MDNIDPNKKLIMRLSDELKEVHAENKMLRDKLSKCEGKLEILNQFYSDFKSLDRIDINNEKPTNSNNAKPEYDALLSNYFVTKDTNIIERLFEDYDVSTAQVLTDIRILSDIKNAFPPNIKSIVKRYNCVDEYNIIRKSLEHIETQKIVYHNIEKGIHKLSDMFINKYIENKKSSAIKYLREVLIYYPFQLNVFLDNISEYKYDDLDNYIENIIVELYGKNTILSKVKTKRKRGRPRKTISDDSSNSNMYSQEQIKLLNSVSEDNKRIKHFIIKPIPELINIITEIDAKNRRNKIIMIYGYLKRLNRNDSELFLSEANKLLIKKVYPNELN